MTMNSLAIDRQLPVALHHQLRTALKRQIDEGRLRPGDKLPTVREISTTCGLSFFTVTRALSDLAREKAIVSRRGSGSYVAPRQAGSTELLFCRHEPRDAALVRFFGQVIDGLEQGYGAPDRTIYVNYVRGTPPTAEQLIEVCRARQTDGMVVYQPSDEMVAALRTVANHVAVVSLMRALDGCGIDSVVSDPAAALSRLLRERIARGARRLVFVGSAESTADTSEPLAPGARLLHGFRAAAAAAGLAAEVLLSSLSWREALERGPEQCAWFEQVAARIAGPAVVVSQNPNVWEQLGAGRRGWDDITYTESRESLAKFRGRVTLLYTGLERLAERAALLLRERIEGGAPRRGVVTAVEPEILERGVVRN